MKKFLISLFVSFCALVSVPSAKADTAHGYIYVQANGQFTPLYYGTGTMTIKAYYNGANQPGYTHDWTVATDDKGQYNSDYPTPPDTAHITKMTWEITDVSFYTIISSGSWTANSYNANVNLYPTTCR